MLYSHDTSSNAYIYIYIYIYISRFYGITYIADILLKIYVSDIYIYIYIYIYICILSD